MSEQIYHITSVAEWESAKQKGQYESPTLFSEGFIHCSTAAQVPATADRFFKGVNNLVVLAINPLQLTCELKYEPATPAHQERPEGNELFPHVFGPIAVSAVVTAQPLEHFGK